MTRLWHRGHLQSAAALSERGRGQTLLARDYNQCLKLKDFHLVAHGLGAAPLQKNLLDAAGTGHPKTLRALQFGFGVHRQRPAVVERTLLVIRPGLACPLTAAHRALACSQHRRPAARRWTCGPERRCCAVKSVTSPAPAACRPPAQRPCRGCWDRLCSMGAQRCQPAQTQQSSIRLEGLTGPAAGLSS